MFSVLFLFGVLTMIAGLVYFLGMFIHKDKQSKAGGYSSVDEPIELEGRIGEAKTDLRPGGIALIDDRRIDVVSEGDFVHKGETVQVIGVRDGKVLVRKI